MASLVAFAEAGFEPIPGYVLREKIGAGGFGEVWLADAPGGLKKALKLVFGSISEDRAAGELRSLQRIRQVNHPFVLSLERIEVVNGQLIVVTELADGSLLDRFRELQRRGMVGIPREKLLRYLGDAADALDFICQQHDLQHLDVKPANLLLIADRIKIADFGLIKDVQRTNNSLLAGLTPTYAAPEMFDGRPGRSSDQYALAIVYQEMLTGCLPFQGRTTAQLASEHLHKAPGLDALPIFDRPVIARALSKKPIQRYASCREMIDALIKAEVGNAIDNVGPPAPARPRAVARAIANPRTRRIHPTRPEQSSRLNSGTQPNSIPSDSSQSPYRTDQFGSQSRPQNIATLPPIDLQEKDARKTINLFVGVGRTGIESIMYARQQLAGRGILEKSSYGSAWLAFDTEAAVLQRATDPETIAALHPSEAIHLPLKTPQYYKEQPKELFTPISRRWLYNIPRSRATEGVRALGMLAYLDASVECYEALYHSISDAMSSSEFEPTELVPNIYIVASAHGGTGGAIVSELAFLVRRVLAELKEDKHLHADGLVTAVITTAVHDDGATLELPAASGMACIAELTHHINTSGLHPGIPALPVFPLSVAPVDDAYFIHGGRLGRTDDWKRAILQAADYLCTDACSLFGTAMQECKQQLRSGEANMSHECTPWMHTFAGTQVELTNELQPSQLTKHFLLETMQKWITAFDSGEAACEPIKPQSANPSSTSTPVRSKKTNQAIELFCDDLFRDVGWNAQAWVRTCFAILIPAAKESSNQKSATDSIDSPGNSSLEDSLLALVDPDLELVQRSLNISIDSSRTIARQLIDSSLMSMFEQLRVHWTTHYQNWAFMSSLLHRVSERLTRQAESLVIVSGRFAERLQAIDIAWIRLPENALEERSQIQTERNTVLVQRDVHQLAASLLKRLASLIDHHTRLWKVESTSLRESLSSYSTVIAQELGLSVDKNGRANIAYLPLPAFWTRVSREVHRALDEAIGRKAIDQLQFVWSSGTNPAIPVQLEALGSSAAGSQEVVQNPASSAASETGGVVNTSVAVQAEVSVDSTIDSPSLYTPELSQLLQIANESQETAAKAQGIALDGGDSVSCPRMTLQTLPEMLRETTPPLLLSGNSKRVFLLLPEDYRLEENDPLCAEELNKDVTIIRTDLVDSPRLVVDGERMILNEVVTSLWPPSSHRSELANRLFSRTDVDWPAII